MALLKIARARGKLPNGKVVDRKLYERWCGMRRRCYDPAFIVYPIYGGAGITVCAEWITDYLAFQKWALANGWRRGLTIDRIDCSKGYSPDNCRWATPKEQSENRAAFSILATLNGVTKNVSVWADELGMPRSTVYARIRLGGWTPERALTEPIVDRCRGQITVDGESHTIYGWCKKLGRNRSWISRQIIDYGKSPESIIRKLIGEK